MEGNLLFCALYQGQLLVCECLEYFLVAARSIFYLFKLYSLRWIVGRARGRGGTERERESEEREGGQARGGRIF